MASITKEAVLNIGANELWGIVAEVDALHTRLVPGFVVDCRLEGDARIVSFANGLVAKEIIIAKDAIQRRLVWAAESSLLTHHNGALQVFPVDAAHSRVVWIADCLPEDMAPQIEAIMDEGMAAMRNTFNCPPLTSSPAN